MSFGLFFASASALRTGSIERSTSGAIICSSFARDRRMSRCIGPPAPTVTYGRLMLVSCTLESSIFAFSAASLRRCRAILSLREVDAVRLLELGDHPVDDQVVDVVAAEVRVAVGRDDLHDVVADLEDRDVERAAAEVVDGDDLVLLLVEAVGERRRRRLVDDALDLEAGDAAGVLRGLALGVVEVRRAR